jgi:putative hydrolase of the HAD superfamily
MIRAVLFDFAGTLANCGDRWWQLELHTTVRAPLALLHERNIISLREGDLERADELYAEMRRVAKETGVEVSAHEATRRAAAALSLSVATGVLDAAVDELFAACLPDMTPLDGAMETLAVLAERGLTLAVISNARHGPFVRWALQRLDLERFFRSIVVSAAVSLRKPRPEIYWNTLSDLDVAAAEAAYVGDYYPFDMVGARAAGLRSIWLVEPGKPREDLPADAVISSLRALPATLDVLSRQ